MRAPIPFPASLPLLLLLAAATPAHARAQSIWTQPDAGRVVTLEVMKPTFAEGELSFATSVAVLGARAPIRENLRLVAEVPFAHAGFDSGFGSESSNTLGNPYLGIAVGAPAGRAIVDLGLRLPFLSDDADDDGSAGFVGALTDVDRMEAFMYDVLPVSAMVRVGGRAPSGLGLRVHGGGSMLFDLSDDEGGDAQETFLRYGAIASWHAPAVRVGAGLTGRWMVTEEYDDFADASLHEIGVSADFGSGRVRPGIQLRRPLDENLSDTMDYVLGLQLSVQLP